MKKLFSSWVLSALVGTMLFSSCHRDNEVIFPRSNADDSEATCEKPMEFQGYAEEIGEGTRTSLEQNGNAFSLKWNAGDKISVYDGTNTAVFSTKQSGSSALFQKESGLLSTGKTYEAFYPSSINPKTPSLPSVQEYVPNGVKNFPMYAVSDDSRLSFKNICGILRLDLDYQGTSQAISIKSISVSCEGKGLSGSFYLDDFNAAVVNGSAGVVLNCSAPIELENDSENIFNIILPKGTYANLKLKVSADDGREMNLVSSSAVSIKRSGITKVALKIESSDLQAELETIEVTEADVDFTSR